ATFRIEEPNRSTRRACRAGLLESQSFRTMNTPGNPRTGLSRRNWLKLAAGLTLGGTMPAARAADRIQRPIPKSGETIPAVGLGTWQAFDVAGDASETAQARDALKALV